MDYKTKTITMATLKRETDRAYLIEKNGTSAWLPKSVVKEMQLENETFNAKGQRVNTSIVFMEVASWITDKDNIKPLL